MSAWHRNNPELYDQIRDVAREQVRDEATSPVTDHHKFEALVDERTEELVADQFITELPEED